MGLQRNVCASLLIASAMLLPAAAWAQDFGSPSRATIAKQFAILGSSSRLQAIKMAQSGMVPPTSVAADGVEPLGAVSPAIARPEGSSSQPDVFGSTALSVERTPLDGKWRRVLAAESADVRSVHLPQQARVGDKEARIFAVNSWINAHIAYGDDRRVWGTDDRWATLSESLRRGSGDCEDYAIAKMELLRAAGIASSDMYLTIVKDLVRRSDHAILIVRVDDRFLVLDNGTDRILDTRDVSDYRPVFSYSANHAWIHGYRKPMQVAALEHVPAPAVGN